MRILSSSRFNHNVAPIADWTTTRMLPNQASTDKLSSGYIFRYTTGLRMIQGWSDNLPDMLRKLHIEAQEQLSCSTRGSICLAHLVQNATSMFPPLQEMPPLAALHSARSYDMTRQRSRFWPQHPSFALHGKITIYSCGLASSIFSYIFWKLLFVHA